MGNQPLSNEEIKNFNKALEERITDAVQDNTKWKSLLPDLMNAEVFIVAHASDREDENGNKLLNILSMTNKQGQQVIPFFTSPNRMAVLAKPDRNTFNCMKMKTIRLFQAIKGKGAVLNPGHANCFKLFTPFEMNLLVMENKDLVK
ncbi:MAG: SseB family protein [Oscillospiraceae bacterium]|nr:SseB family protein [Oscillospiraceae bacterium]